MIDIEKSKKEFSCLDCRHKYQNNIFFRLFLSKNIQIINDII